ALTGGVLLGPDGVRGGDDGHDEQKTEHRHARSQPPVLSELSGVTADTVRAGHGVLAGVICRTVVRQVAAPASGPAPGHRSLAEEQ
ncbi:hypothetical protein AB0K48_07545, partial [Nonomuraea sp. NPDC055795]